LIGWTLMRQSRSTERHDVLLGQASAFAELSASDQADERMENELVPI
jgi:hypothetical protein